MLPKMPIAISYNSMESVMSNKIFYILTTNVYFIKKVICILLWQTVGWCISIHMLLQVKHIIYNYNKKS